MEAGVVGGATAFFSEWMGVQCLFLSRDASACRLKDRGIKPWIFRLVTQVPKVRHSVLE